MPDVQSYVTKLCCPEAQPQTELYVWTKGRCCIAWLTVIQKEKSDAEELGLSDCPHYAKGRKYPANLGRLRIGQIKGRLLVRWLQWAWSHCTVQQGHFIITLCLLISNPLSCSIQQFNTLVVKQSACRRKIRTRKNRTYALPSALRTHSFCNDTMQCFTPGMELSQWISWCFVLFWIRFLNQGLWNSLICKKAHTHYSWLWLIQLARGVQITSQWLSFQWH